MGNTDRLYRIESLIRQRGTVTMEQLIDELEVSRATLKRDLAFLRDRMGAPIDYDRFHGGYRFSEQGQDGRGDKHELPGLWFDERELYALLMAHQLISGLGDEGVLGRHLQPLLQRIHEMLGTDEAQSADILRRVRIITPAKRPVPGQWFERASEALIQRKRLQLAYHTRSRGESGTRSVSPQRLVHYRATWYLDAFCHRSNGLRRFALDAIEEAQVTAEKAVRMDLREVEAAMDGGYGIYAGAKASWAVLEFAPQAAQWISREQWHPLQEGRWLPDGSYELRVPYAQEIELAMDILRHGSQVKVKSPASLVRRVRQALDDALAQYR